MKKLQYFVGKLCTVLTRPASRFFDETQYANVFLGIVDSVDDFGIWLIQLNTKKRSFFFAHNLIGVVEETVTMVSDEEVHLIKKEVVKRAEDSQTNLVQLDKLKLLKKTANKEPQK